MKSTANKISPYGRVKFKSIEEYHASFPKNIRNILQQLRQTIEQASPNAIEVITYNIPGFKQYRGIIAYAGYKNHIGFYPGSTALIAFKDEIKKFNTSKGTIQFPLDKPLPLPLIKKIVKFNVIKDLEKAKTNKSKSISLSPNIILTGQP